MALTSIIVKEIAAVAVTAGTAVGIWTPAAGKKFRLCGYRVGVSVAGAVIFKEGAGNTAIGVRSATMGANFGDGADIGMGAGVLSAAADNVLKIDVTVSSTVNGYVWGYEE